MQVNTAGNGRKRNRPCFPHAAQKSLYITPGSQHQARDQFAVYRMFNGHIQHFTAVINNDIQFLLHIIACERTPILRVILNDQAFQNWDFGHIDPTGAQKGVDARGNVILCTAGDLAAVMSLNPDLKVLSANGYYDFVTPFYQTIIDLQKMPLQSQAIRNNLNATFYPSGHMIYLDGGSRTALKADLARMYRSAVANRPALARVRALQARTRVAMAG